MASELWRLTAREAVARLKAREVSPSELVAAALARIDETDGDLNAVPTLCAERAYAAAKRIEAAGPSDVPGHLQGLPIVVKDLTNVAGVRTTFGSPIFADNVPATSDMVVERLEAMGAVVLGKSNTPEFGAGSHTFNEVFGVTRNPWDTRVTCGGSSGGAAVALAAGQIWLATGTDMGGSLRTPAAFCSIVGFRTSPGRVPRGTTQLPMDRLSVHGPMARNVRDAALMLDAEVGFDPRDPLSLPAPAQSFLEAVDRLPAPARIAWSPDLGITPIDPEVREIAERAARWFQETGAVVEEAAPDLKDARDIFQVLRAQNFYATRGPLLEKHRDKLKPEVIWNVEKGQVQDAETVARAERARGLLYYRAAAFFENHDLLLTPMTIAPPFPVEKRYLEELAGVRFDTYIDWMSLAFAVTVTELPALSLPCGFTAAGLPVGLQVIGRPRGEAEVLAAAARFEDAHEFASRVPTQPLRRH